VTDRADYPEHVAGYALRDVDALVAQAGAHGPTVGEYARRLLGLARRHGGPSVDAACAKLLAIDVVDLRRATRILDAALEHARDDSGDSGDRSPRVVVPAAARFARDPGEFAVSSTPGGTSGSA